MTEIGWPNGIPPFIRYAPMAREYVKAWRKGNTIVRAGGLVRLYAGGIELDRRAFEAEMREALDRRINLRGGLASDGRDHNGRRTQPLYQVELMRDAQEIQRHCQTGASRVWGLNGRRWRTDIVQRRLGYLLDVDG